MRLSLSTLLSVLYVGVTLASVLMWLGLLAAAAILFIGLSAAQGPLPSVAYLLAALVVVLPTLWGLGHLRAALRQARDFTPLDGEVARRVGQGGRWLLWGGVAALPLSALLLWLDPKGPGLLWTPSGVLSTLLGLAVPLLLIGLSGWLDEGRRLRDRAREVV